jgi:SAM-dependent methyltransferase
MFLGRVARRLRAEGPAGLLSAVGERLEDWRDARFDRRFGIDTGFEPGHQPIQIPAFDRIVGSLPIARGDWGFTDYGCGKGRALVLAAEHGFAHVRGIERDPAFHAQALRNVGRYRERRPSAPRIEVVLGDAATLAPPASRSVLFLYNPFDAATLGRLLERLRAGWQGGAPEWIIAYRTPANAQCVRDAGWLEPLVERTDFCTWRTRPGMA